MTQEARSVRLFGAQRTRTFREAATKYLEESTHKRSLERDARALKTLDRFVGELALRRVHHDTLQPFVRTRLQAGISPGTINRDLAVVRRILNLSARLWRDESDRPWLTTAPLIQMQRHPHAREPYPLSMEEERLLISELAGHLSSMALFNVNTGLREQEVVKLRWNWEVKVPELSTSLFVIPRDYVKNGLDRYVILNPSARSVLARCRGKHPEFVFTRAGQMEGRPPSGVDPIPSGVRQRVSGRISIRSGARSEAHLWASTTSRRRGLRGPQGPARPQIQSRHHALLGAGDWHADRSVGAGVCTAVPQKPRTLRGSGLTTGCKCLIGQWLWRASNPRPRHYECHGSQIIRCLINALPRGVRCRLAPRSTTEHDGLSQDSYTLLRRIPLPIAQSADTENRCT